MIRIDEWHIRKDVNLDEAMYVRKGRMNVWHGGMDASKHVNLCKDDKDGYMYGLGVFWAMKYSSCHFC